MEKWRSKGKSCSKEESVLPPTKRPSSHNCLPADKKKDRKWSFGGLLRRISLGHNNDVSSNDEDITYIPGHMLLAKRQTKKISNMKSKLGDMQHGSSVAGKSGHAEENYRKNESNETTERVASTVANIVHSQDSICCALNDSVNSPSSEGSLDAAGKNSRMNRMKARARAKRDRLRANSSSEDDSHRSSQSSVKFRSEDNAQNVQRTDSCNRRTRGARTERYIKRISRDDCNSGSDTKLPISTNSSSNPTTLEYYTNHQDSMIQRTTDSTRNSSTPGQCCSVFVENSRLFIDDERRNLGSSSEMRYEARLSDRLGHDESANFNVTRESEKFTWPKTNFRRDNNTDNEIYGTLRPMRQITAKRGENNDEKILPPEPPPRSSKSRVFENMAGNASFLYNNPPLTRQFCRRYYQPTETTNIRSYNSDNEILHDYRCSEIVSNNLPDETSDYRWKNENFKSLDRTYVRASSLIRPKREYNDKQEIPKDRDYSENLIYSSNNHSRNIDSRTKGVELFSRQKFANCPNNERDYETRETSSLFDESNLTNNPVSQPIIHRESFQNQATTKICDDNEAERKRSSKNLQEALFELEAIYNSLRLSDPDLLERAEQRTMDEYRDRAAKSAAENSLKSCCSETSSNDNHEFFDATSKPEANLRITDDMAYRRMNPQERPMSVNGQSSLSRISYLATSPNLSIRDNESSDRRYGRNSPDLTRDDLLFRNISHAINTLKVIEPQPPFGIPIGPVTAATESDYLHVKPATINHGQTRSLYIPKSEPDVVSDDLAFRNLRKDKDNFIGINKNTNIYLQTDSFHEPDSTTRYETTSLGTRKKRSAFGSISADKTSRDNDWYNDYARKTQKLYFPIDKVENFNTTNFTIREKKIFNDTANTYDFRNNTDLDINGNRPKSDSQRKILVNVPRDTSCSRENEKYFIHHDAKFSPNNSDYSSKLIVTESEDSSHERCDSSTSDIQPGNNDDDDNDDDDDDDDDEKNIEQFTEQEISEYKQLCQDLEKLIQQTVDEETTKKREIDEIDEIPIDENNSQSDIDDWDRLFNDDYKIPSSILNFDENSIIPIADRDDDRSSSRSMGLSSENLAILSTRKRNDKFVEDDLLSSTSELGICSNNESLNDSVYDKFNQLLEETDDIHLVKCTNKIGKYPINELDNTTRDYKDIESIVENKSSSIEYADDYGDEVYDIEYVNDDVDEESMKKDEESLGIFDNASHVLEYRTKILSPDKHLEDQYLTNNMIYLKGLTRRVRNEENHDKTRDKMSKEKMRVEREMDDDDDEKLAYREGEKKIEYALGSENLFPLSTKRIDKFEDDDVLSSASGICSNNETMTESYYDKFDKLLREVNDIPIVARTDKMGKYPTDELIANNTHDSVDIESNVKHKSRSIDCTNDDEESAKNEEQSLVISDKALQYRGYGTKVVSPNDHLEDKYLTKNLKYLNNVTRRVRNDEANNENCGTFSERKTRPERENEAREIDDDDDDDDDDDKTFACREGEKNVEDEIACNDDAYAFKETSMKNFRKLCHFINSITLRDIVLCLFFLTLLITIIFAQ